MYAYTETLGEDMQYTLITNSGKIMQFYILAVAEMYQQGLGGVVITPQILEQTLVDSLAV